MACAAPAVSGPADDRSAYASIAPCSADTPAVVTDVSANVATVAESADDWYRTWMVLTSPPRVLVTGPAATRTRFTFGRVAAGNRDTDSPVPLGAAHPHHRYPAPRPPSPRAPSACRSR